MSKLLLALNSKIEYAEFKPELLKRNKSEERVNFNSP